MERRRVRVSIAERQEVLVLTVEEERRERKFITFARRSLQLAQEKGLPLRVIDLISQAHNMARTGRDWCVEERKHEDSTNFESTWGLQHGMAAWDEE